MKIKSHMKLEEASCRADEWHIQGNALADKAAGHSRSTDDPEFSHLCQQIRKHRQQQHSTLLLVYNYLVAFAHKRRDKLASMSESDAVPNASLAPTARNTSTVFTRTLRIITSWTVAEPHYQYPPEPHRVVFWCSPWGVNLTRMVWEFCSTLRWPDPAQPTTPNDYCISWTELAPIPRCKSCRSKHDPSECLQLSMDYQTYPDVLAY